MEGSVVGKLPCFSCYEPHPLFTMCVQLISHHLGVRRVCCLSSVFCPSNVRGRAPSGTMRTDRSGPVRPPVGAVPFRHSGKGRTGTGARRKKRKTKLFSGPPLLVASGLPIKPSRAL
jgi:hypothetical protein